VVTWTIWLTKTIEMAAAKRQVRRSYRALRDAPNLTLAAENVGSTIVPRAVVREASDEWRRSVEALANVGSSNRGARTAQPRAKPPKRHQQIVPREPLRPQVDSKPPAPHDHGATKSRGRASPSPSGVVAGGRLRIGPVDYRSAYLAGAAA
jgi:hypothetical protein